MEVLDTPYSKTGFEHKFANISFLVGYLGQTKFADL